MRGRGRSHVREHTQLAEAVFLVFFLVQPLRHVSTHVLLFIVRPKVGVFPLEGLGEEGGGGGGRGIAPFLKKLVYVYIFLFRTKLCVGGLSTSTTKTSSLVNVLKPLKG